MVSSQRSSRRQRRGKVLVLIVVLLPILVGMVAFGVDLGYVALVRTTAQVAADAAAMAAAAEILGDRDVATETAIQFAQRNAPHYGDLLKAEDVTFGTWDFDSRTFTAGGDKPNAVRVFVRCTQANGNPASLFFGGVWGRNNADVYAEAIAVGVTTPEFRYLLDDDIIDADLPVIQAEAARAEMPPEQLISDHHDSDGFIDLPPGCILELPTGQVGDEALFDIKKFTDSWPFQPESTVYSTTDYLAEGTALVEKLHTHQLQDVIWEVSEAPIPDLNGRKVLDPVPGTAPLSNPADIAALPDPYKTYVSPLYKNDVSLVERDPTRYGSPMANLTGQRRGLVHYRILSSRPNPAGGSYLPLLTIEILEPIELEQLGTGARRVALVK